MAGTRGGAFLRGAALLLAAALALLAGTSVFADDGSAQIETRREALALSGRATLVERPFAFVVDPSTPGRGGFSMGLSVGMGSGIAPDRPLPVTLAASGLSNAVTATYGVGERVAPYASAILMDQRAATVAAGVTVQLARPTAPLRATISAGALHEGSTGANGATLLAAASLEEGPVRIAGNLRTEKMFAASRDRLDVVAVAGGSVRIAGGVRVGGEYVGQDLEETFSTGAEGTALHAIGPDAALELEGGRYQLTAATLFGVTPASPRALVRAGFSLNF